MPPRSRRARQATSRSPSPAASRGRRNAAAGPSAADMATMFESVDLDGNGTINWFELKIALEKFGLEGGAERAKQMIAEADNDDNDELDMEEFGEIMGSEISSDEWVALSTSLKHRLLSEAKETYAQIVPVVVLERAECAYHFPNPEGPSLCCSAYAATFAVAIIGGMVAFMAPELAPLINVVGFVYGCVLLYTESTSVALKHLAQLKWVDMNGHPSGCCTMLAQPFLSVVFTALFGMEYLACMCDMEQRPLSMQLLGVRFARIGDSYTGQLVATRRGRTGGRGLARTSCSPVTIITIVTYVFIAIVPFYCAFVAIDRSRLEHLETCRLENLKCVENCARAWGKGPGICTGMCDANTKPCMELGQRPLYFYYLASMRFQS